VRDPSNKRRCAHLDRLVAAGEAVEVVATELSKADGYVWMNEVYMSSSLDAEAL
jgi:hypothetical protein